MSTSSFVSRIALVAALAASALASSACVDARTPYPATDQTLALRRVVLYRNGVGYFERSGRLEGNLLSIKVRKDSVDDLLKSLTVVERAGGRAVSISMPLDPQSWANAALATLGPGRGSLAEVLDALRGTHVTLVTADSAVSGRIVMVEAIEAAEPPLRRPQQAAPEPPMAQERDHKVTLLDGANMSVVRLSEVVSLKLEDGDLALALQRSLDASAGEGMFQQVDVAIRLSKPAEDLAVSYVVAAPMWKPTYRIVLPKSGKGKALLQAWAVVDNTSGEDWRDVAMTLTSGAPIAFRYDLHTPRNVERSDLTESGVRRQARAAVGESTFEEAEKEAPPPMASPAPAAAAPAEAYADVPAGKDVAAARAGEKRKAPSGGAGAASNRPVSKAEAKTRDSKASSGPAASGGYAAGQAAITLAEPTTPPAVDFDSLQRSMRANTRATQASGLTRFDIQERITVPSGTSTMVAIINETVEGEETFLYRPGGAGVGYEANPYRVVRFRNVTPYVLEPGPISIYAGGSFVGEGLSEAVGTKTSATVPFAVEPGILVSSTAKNDGDQLRLLRIVRGVLEVESFARKTTVWTARLQKKSETATTVLVRHPKAGWNFQIEPRPAGTEDLPDAYLVPVNVPAGQLEASVTVVEQTPSRITIGIWETRALPLLEALLVGTELPADARKKLEPVVQRRQAIGKIDTQIDGLKRQQGELDQRANETRQNLEALKRDNAPAAAALRKRLGERLEQFTKDGDKLGREVVELQTKRLEIKVELEDMLQNLDLSAPPPKPGAPKTTPAAPAAPTPAQP